MVPLYRRQHFPLELRGVVIKAAAALIFKAKSGAVLLTLPRGCAEEGQQEKKNLSHLAWTSPRAHVVQSAPC